MAFRDLTRGAALRIPAVRALHSHAQSLASERERLADQVRQLCAERDALRSSLEEARQDLDRTVQEKESAAARANQAETVQAVMEHRIGLLENSHRVASQALHDARAGREELAIRAAELETQLAQAGDPNPELAARNEDLELRLYLATSDAQRAAVLNDQLMRDLRAAHDKLRSLVEESGGSAALIETLRTEIETLRAETEALQAQGETLDAARRSLEAERAELETAVERQLDVVMGLERTRSALQGEVNELRSAEETLSAERDELQAERERLEAALAAQSGLVRSAEEALSAERDGFQVERERLAAALAAQTAATAESQGVRVELEAELARRQQQAAEGAARLQQVGQELETARAALEEARGREAASAAQRATMEAQLARLAEVQAHNAQLTAEAAELRTRTAVLEQEAERLRNEERRLVQARAELADLHARVAALDSEVARGREQSVVLTAAQAEVATLRERLAGAEAQRAAMERDAPALQHLALQAAETTRLKTQLTDARDRLSARMELMSFEMSDLRRGLHAAGDGSSPAGRRLYLDLLEGILTGALTEDENMSPWSAHVYDPEVRLYGRDWPKTAKTMIGVARMRNLRRLVETALEESVPGDLLEAGVWRGGACIYMRAVLAAYGVTDRTVWVADSFAGLPPPDAQRYPADRNDPHHTFTDLIVPLDEVKRNFQQFSLLDQQVAFLPGWFKDTLPTAPVEKLSVLRLDGDMYGSTMETLEALYHKVSPGGFIVVDDYFLAGCRQAVDDFRAQRRIRDPMQEVDGAASYWRKGLPQTSASLPRQVRGGRRAAGPKTEQA